MKSPQTRDKCLSCDFPLIAWHELGMDVLKLSVTMKGVLINTQVKQSFLMKKILEENRTSLGAAFKGPPDPERGKRGSTDTFTHDLC